MNELRFNILLILFLLVCQPVFSQKQQYKVTILDSISNNPVEFSTISWGNGKGTISDINGFVRFNIEQKELDDTLTVSCIGYNSEKVPIPSLSRNELNKIYLSPQILELDQVTVETKQKRAPKSKKIIIKAISNIHQNYSTDTVVYHGYFREYTKQPDEYINVFESVLELQDPGFDRPGHFRAKLLYKHLNDDFKTNRLLLAPYDNFKKYVPYSHMPEQYRNELEILLAHDPVRNYNSFSFDFIATMEKDFISNHEFSEPKLTYLQGEPFYYIKFEDDLDIPWYRDQNFSTKGYLYIHAKDYGIKKINYKLFLNTLSEKQKFYELNLDYKKSNNKYFLNYLSFNNLFRTRDLALLRKKVDTNHNTINLFFNKKIDEKTANDFQYNITWKNEPVSLKKIKADQSKIILKLNDTDLSINEHLRIDIDWINDDLERDSNGGVQSYYQFREFFTKEVIPKKRLHHGLMDKSKPVMQNPVTYQGMVDTTWLNTPLIKEHLYTNRNNKINSQFLQIMEASDEWNAKRKNELVFLHTDREIYYPGDTLWFKAYVRDKATLRESSLSRDLFVYLFNENGSLVHDAKFLVSDGGVKGQMPLDRDLRKGDYYIAAYSSWMQNFGIGEVFKKKIRVRYLKKESYELIPSYDKEAYFPGDTVYMEINCHDELRREEEKVGFAWKVKSGSTTITRGIANALNGYDNQVRSVVPRDIQKPCRLEISGDHQLVELDKTYQIPVHFNVHVDFFPEGGRALNGAMNNIAFKAVYSNGLPAHIEGEIIDDKGNVLNTVASQHQGMGTFPFIPKKDAKYYLKITKPAGIAQQYKLPPGKDRGWHLGARNNKSKVYVNIQKQGLPTDTCLLTLMIRDRMFYSRVVTIDKARSLTIPTDNLPSGIGVLTLLDQALLPRAERLVFVNYHKRQQVEMTTGSRKYGPREKVTLNIQVTGPANQSVQGDYSLAVVDQKLGLSEKIENTSLFSAGFFSPEIKGRVFNPGYYFKTGSRQEQYHLDLLLLTQGWRNYRYLDQIQNIDSLPAPVNQDEISGRILEKQMLGKPEPTKGEVTVYFGGVSHTLETDPQGRFSFRPVFEGVNPNILLSATDEEGKEDVIIRLASNRYENRLINHMPSLIDSLDQQHVSPVQTHESIEKFYEWMGLNYYLIDPVTVTARGPKKERDIEKRVIDNMPDRYKKTAPQSYIENNEDVYDILYDMKKEMDLRIRYNIEKDRMEYYYWGILSKKPWRSIIWYVDGFKWQMDPRRIYPPAIKDFKLLTGETPKLLFGDPALKPDSAVAVVYITTDSTKYQTWKRAYQMAHRKALPKYTFTKEFHKPIYDTEEKKENPRFDFRKTIHWEPEVQLDSNGRATVTFYNADQYTNIKCILQGISDKGIPAYGEAGYEVKFVE